MLDETLLKNIQDGDLISLVGRSPLIPFNLFWVKKNGKRVLLKGTGEFASSEEMERWISKGLNLETESLLNDQWVKEGFEKFVAFEQLHQEGVPNPFGIQEWCKDWICFIHPFLWEKEASVSKLDICFLMGVIFYDLTNEEEGLFLNYPIELQKKNYLMASFGMILAIVAGYSDKKFLKDYFKILLFWDAPFTQTIWSESEAQFLKQEWSEPGLGFTLSSETKEQIVKLYDEKTIKVKDELAKTIKFKGLLKYMDWAFETLNGQGHPYGFKVSGLSDLDVLTIFLAHRFSYEEENLAETENGILSNLFEVSPHLKKSNLSMRFEVIVKTAFSKALELKGGFLEIAGL